MAHIVVLGAGLGGTIMAYEMKDQLRPETRYGRHQGSEVSFRAVQSVGRGGLAQARGHRG